MLDLPFVGGIPLTTPNYTMAGSLSEKPSGSGLVSSHAQSIFVDTVESNLESNKPISADVSDKRLNDLGYKSEFRRDMSLFGVLGVSFCAIGILTGMSSAFQTGLFSGGPLGLFWGWNVSALLEFKVRVVVDRSRRGRYAVSSCCLLRCPLRRSVVPSMCSVRLKRLWNKILTT